MCDAKLGWAEKWVRGEDRRQSSVISKSCSGLGGGLSESSEDFKEWPGGLLGRSTYHSQRITGTDLQRSNDLLPAGPRESTQHVKHR